MTNKKSIWAFVLAFMLVVPAMFLFSACGKHKHSFSSEWSQSETQHWHACTGKNCDEKQDLADHDFVWVEKTPAGVHVNKVEEGTCSTCNFKMDRTVPNTATHSYETASWEKDETGHWHKSTCDATDPAHQGLKNDFAEHAYGAWTVKTPAEFHKNRVDHRLCSVCGFEDTKEVPESMEHTWEYKYDDQNHWEETTCAGHDKLIRNKEAHTTKWQILNNQEHQLLTDCEEHGLYSIKTGNHRYDNVDDTTCNDCGYVRTLSGKGSINTIAQKTYNCDPQPIGDSDYTVHEDIKGICTIQYKLKSQDDSAYSTVAPSDAGEYDVRIFCNGNDIYPRGEVAKTTFRIKGVFVQVNNQFPLKDNGGSSLYIDLVNVTASGGSLSQSKNLTLRVLKSNAEEFSEIGRHEIDYLKGKLVFVDADSPDKPVNKNYIPTFNNFNAATVYLLRYSTENTTIKMETPSTTNITYTSNLVTFSGMKVVTGFIKVGDYVTFDDHKTFIRVGDTSGHRYIVEGEKTTNGIKFATDGKPKEFWEGLVGKTFTKVETLNFEEGKRNTNTVSRQINKGECFYLAFTTDDVTSVKTYKVNFDASGTGYVANRSFVFLRKDGTVASGGETLNVTGKNTYILKVTKVEESEPGKESVDFYISKW